MKDSKARRKEKRIQQLGKDVAEQKKGKTQKEIQTVHMDEVQIDEFLKALTERVEWSANRIVDERPRPIIVERGKARELGGVATLLKWSMGALFFIAATLIVHISAGQLRHQRCYIAWREHNIILSVIFDMYPVSQRVENFPSKIKVQIALQTSFSFVVSAVRSVGLSYRLW